MQLRKGVEPILIPADSNEVFDDVGTVYFVGTATCLIRFGGLTVLTDPNFLHRGEKVHLGYGLTATRRTEPALSIEQLPHIDVVVLSHMHEDHFDRVAADKLDKRIPIVTTKHASVALQRKGFLETYAPPTWEAIEVQKGETRLSIAAMPGRHGPGFLDFVMPPVMGSLLDFSTPDKRYRMYVSGDTLPIQELRKIPERYPGIDLGLFHLGGTKIAGITVTMDGKMGVNAVEMVDPNLAIPIHYDDYDRFKSPLDDFKREVERVGLGNRVRYLERGEVYTFTPKPQREEVVRARISRISHERVTAPLPIT
jgi:L-ascorbate metabolism protein UlaG (beta-lactamase superfamily)